MKSLLPKALAVLLLASCSAPKYSYYFDHHDYNAGRRNKNAIENNVAVQSIATEVTNEKLTIPESNQEVVLASVKKEVLPIKQTRTITTERKTTPAISREQRKELKKQIKTEIKKYKKETKDLAKQGTGGGNQLVALLLAIFLGGFGIHRFYLGRTMTGIYQLGLLVLGAFLIIPLYILAVWVLIDIIFIAMGKLTPASGSYSKPL